MFRILGWAKGACYKGVFYISIKEIEKDTCNVLRISDYNTTGLLGSREPINTDWTNLTKSSGASDKKGTAGGSYGIGKFAPFACSFFSTVFYSTFDVKKRTIMVFNLEEYSEYLLDEEGYSGGLISYVNGNKASLRYKFLLRTAIVDQSTEHKKY